VTQEGPPLRPSAGDGAKPDDLAAHPEIARARAGDVAALAEMLNGLRQYLLAIAEGELDAALRGKLGASDLVQETFVRAQQRFAAFAGSTEDELRAWVRQILLNQCLDVRDAFLAAKRDIKREVSIDAPGLVVSLVDALPLDTPSPGSRVVAADEDARMAVALDQLPADYRQVVWLRNWEGQEFEEIGRQMDRSADAVRKLFARAVAKLAEILDDKNEEPRS
jgi:RNA polymerase sigma-70 factor (ECF subfamily)